MATARPSPTPPTTLSPGGSLRHHTPEQRSQEALQSGHQEALGPPSWFRPPPDKLEVSLGRPPPMPGAPISPSCVDFSFLAAGPLPKSTSHPAMDFNRTGPAPRRSSSHPAVAPPSWLQPPGPQANQCPSRHTLADYVTLGGCCDGCGVTTPPGTNVMDCRVCNWYLCDKCSGRKATTPLASACCSFAEGESQLPKAGHAANLWRASSEGAATHSWPGQWNWSAGSQAQAPPWQPQGNWPIVPEAATRPRRTPGGFNPSPQLGPMLHQPVCF